MLSFFWKTPPLYTPGRYKTVQAFIVHIRVDKQVEALEKTGLFVVGNKQHRSDVIMVAKHFTTSSLPSQDMRGASSSRRKLKKFHWSSVHKGEQVVEES